MFKKAFSLLSIGAGVFVLVQVVMPLVSFKIWEMTSYYQNQDLTDPTPENQNILGVSVQNTGNFPAIVSQNHRLGPFPYQEFTLNIPSINLPDSRVVVESNNFDQNLAQLPGSALPGEVGNVFITGHSSLPQLYKPDNYKAIFSNLPNIKKGGKIIVNAGGQQFEYMIEGLKVVDPSDVSVINPPNSTGRYLTLMTCVPPGLYLKRLIVLAQLR